MNYAKTSPLRSIKKLHIEAAALFAINNIPGIDEETLQKFLELVNVAGNFGSVSEEELLEKMRLFHKYIPAACGYSLLTLAELLEMHLSATIGRDDGAITVYNNEAALIPQPGYREAVT